MVHPIHTNGKWLTFSWLSKCIAYDTMDFNEVAHCATMCRHIMPPSIFKYKCKGVKAPRAPRAPAKNKEWSPICPSVGKKKQISCAL